jgi:hypothetical protein
MKSHTLCRERLEYLLEVLERHEGRLSIRNLWRSYVIAAYEIRQAEELGWIRTFTHKPPRGRPSRICEKVSKTLVAKYPNRSYGGIGFSFIGTFSPHLLVMVAKTIKPRLKTPEARQEQKPAQAAFSRLPK